MCIADKISAQVQTLADSMAADVLTKAIFKQNIPPCSGCNYRDNRLKFASVLALYANAKRDVARFRILLNRHVSNDSFKDVSYTLWEKAADELQLKVLTFRDMLDKIRPCPECKKYYNPTGIVKYLPLMFKGSDLKHLFFQGELENEQSEQPVHPAFQFKHGLCPGVTNKRRDDFNREYYSKPYSG